MTTAKSRRRNELEHERIADWLDQGILKYDGYTRINTVIDFHGEYKGYHYHGCRCKPCTNANRKYQNNKNDRKRKNANRRCRT